MIKIGEFHAKFCIINEDERYLEQKEVSCETKNIGCPMKIMIPTKIEPLKPPSDTIPHLSDSKQNTSRIKNILNESTEIKNNFEMNNKITIDKNTTNFTISKKNVLELLSNNNNNNNPDNSADYFVEKRYCTKCSLEQPLRCKHCSFCQRCVGTYDHHCAWIGTYSLEFLLNKP